MSETTVSIEKYREILSQSAMKDAKIQHLTESLKDAEYLLTQFKTEKDSVMSAERDEAIDQIVFLTKGKTTKESLKDASKETIATSLKTALQMTTPSSIAIMRQADIDAAKMKKPEFTVGYKNPESGKWEGGL